MLTKCKYLLKSRVSDPYSEYVRIRRKANEKGSHTNLKHGYILGVGIGRKYTRITYNNRDRDIDIFHKYEKKFVIMTPTKFVVLAKINPKP